MPSYERTGSDLDKCQENNAEIQDAISSDSRIDINGCYGELATYLKGEAKCICSELFLYADYFHCGLLNSFKIKYFKQQIL